MKYPSLCLLLGAALAGDLAFGAAKDAKVPVAIFATAYAEGFKSVFVKGGKETFQSVTLSTANVVEGELALVEAGEITLYGPPTADGEHPAVASVQLDEIKRPLLVLKPSEPGEEGPYQVKAIEADLKSFPLGSFKFVNLSPHPVRLTYGQDVMEIESGAESLFRPDVPDGEVAAVTIDYKNEDAWVLLTSARWASRSDRRTLVCFQQDATTKRMLAKSVPLRGSTQ